MVPVYVDLSFSGTQSPKHIKFTKFEWIIEILVRTKEKVFLKFSFQRLVYDNGLKFFIIFVN